MRCVDAEKAKDHRCQRRHCHQYGADALLVIQGVQQTDRFLNPSAVLNLTVVGGFIIPASHRDSLFLVEGVLVDFVSGSATANGLLQSITCK
jgi:hypothetical protein